MNVYAVYVYDISRGKLLIARGVHNYFHWAWEDEGEPISLYYFTCFLNPEENNETSDMFNCKIDDLLVIPCYNGSEHAQITIDDIDFTRNDIQPLREFDYAEHLFRAIHMDGQ